MVFSILYYFSIAQFFFLSMTRKALGTRLIRQGMNLTLQKLQIRPKIPLETVAGHYYIFINNDNVVGEGHAVTSYQL